MMHRLICMKIMRINDGFFHKATTASHWRFSNENGRKHSFQRQRVSNE
jgi:hypothetical protein